MLPSFLTRSQPDTPSESKPTTGAGYSQVPIADIESGSTASAQPTSSWWAYVPFTGAAAAEPKTEEIHILARMLPQERDLTKSLICLALAFVYVILAMAFLT